MKKTQRNWKKIILVPLAAFLATNIFIIMPAVTVIVYESVFNRRYEAVSWMEYDVSEFEGLQMDSCSFPSDDGQILAGYRYSKENRDVKGVVVLVHGLGCGGQNFLMPFADLFTSEGYFVFAYDATGNGNSEGDSVRGLPQGVVDLDYALRYVKEDSDYEGLPIFLLGHSWGAYSAGAVLEIHPDVAGVVMLSGPNKSIDLMVESAKDTVGFLGIPEIPYLMLYETLKFGKYSGYNGVDSFSGYDGSVMIVHSKDDMTVPVEIGYDVFYETYGDDPRFSFVLYEDKGHDYIFCSDKSKDRREELNRKYIAYVETNGGEYNAEIKEEFMIQYLDKSLCFELDPELSDAILVMFEDVLREG